MKHLIVDTGALIKGVNLDVYHSENVWTINEVLDEVRDKVSRRLVQDHPTLSTLQTREPNPEDIKAVVEFSKETGDFASLSKTDIKVLALTVYFERETHNNSISHLRKSPLLALPASQQSTTAQSTQTNETQVDPQAQPQDQESTQQVKAEEQKQTEPEPIEQKVDTNNDLNSPPQGEQTSEEDEENGEDEGDEDDANEEDEWITPDNLHLQKAKNSMAEPLNSDGSKQVEVACITTDFSMQNVMLQMGLNLVSLDGLRIKTAKIFILRCETCFKVVRDVTKLFCPSCGYQNLRKSTMFTSEDGKISYYTPPRRSGIRGTQFAIPLPKGGRKKSLPILSEDELLNARQHSYNQRNKKNNSENEWEEQYIFAQQTRKPSHERPIGFGHKNPNQPKHRVGKRKKNKRIQ